jgi:hypothetical protein
LAVDTDNNHNWYVRRGDEVRGPFPAGLVSRYVLLGRIRLSDEVSHDREEWFAVSQVRELVPDVMLEAAAHADDEEAQRRLDAARRWADERRSPDGSTVTGDRRGATDELRGYREMIAEREAGEAPAPRKTVQYLIVAAVVALIVAIPFLLPSGPDTGEPQCNAPAAPGVNWSNCGLEGSQLADVDLSRAALRNVQLARSVLRAANLSGADIAYGDLSYSIMRGANLQGANLLGTDLRGVDLSRADLKNANLSYADLTDAHLDGADLTGARLGHAVWGEDLYCMPDSVGHCRLARPAR